MQSSTSRASRWALSFTIVAIGTLSACADDPVAPAIPTTPAIDRPNAAVGDVYVVTTSSGGTEVGSLRWAVAQATTGGEIVRFGPDLAGDTITLDSTIVIKHPITIEGPMTKGVTISGDDKWQIFQIQSALASATTLRNLALVKGMGAGSAGGGGVFAASDVVLENVTLSNHRGYNYPALYAETNATLINTTISGNVSEIYAAAWVREKLTLINSTIAHNNKGGIALGKQTTLRNSLIAFNGAGPNCQQVQTVEYYGRNLSTDWSCGDTNRVLVADAKIDSLRDNGGPGRTHALQRTSPAINAGKDCTVSVDERYVTRDSTCDIGAFEFTDFTIATLTPNTSAPVDPTDGWVTVSGLVSCSRDEKLDLAVVLKQEQRVGRASGIVQASGTVTVDCTTSAKPWAVAVAAVSGVFGNGPAIVEVKTANTPRWVTPSAVSAPVKLYWGRR